MLKLIALVSLLGLVQAEYWKYNSDELQDSKEHGTKTGKATTNCACGWANKARVVGGKETLANEYPYMVAIVNKQKGKVFCGGSIITPRHILTASHCTVSRKMVPMAVIAGGHNIYDAGAQTDSRVVVDVDYTVEHDNYNGKSYDNDIAIMVLKTPIAFNQKVGPVCLPTGQENIVNEFIKVLGWGLLANKGSSSKVLMKVDLRVIPLEDCVTNHIRFPIDTTSPRQICTYRRNKDSCQGDSGGPLIRLDPATQRFTQVALVSFGSACASIKPAVNTDVGYHMPWIRKVISEHGGDNVCTRV